MRRLCQLLIVSLCCLSFLAVAQQESIPPASTPAIPQLQTAPPARSVNHTPLAANRRISLDVVVTDKSGNPVSGLQQPDFSVLDDKQAQTIVAFHAFDGSDKAADPPQQAILVIDAVNTSFRNVGYLRQELEKLLRSYGEQLPLPVSIAFFTDKGTVMQPAPSRESKTVLEFLKSNDTNLRIIDRSQGFYGAVDRQQISIPTLQGLVSYATKQPGRKLIVWISPGWPILTGPNIELGLNEQEALFRTVVEFSTGMRQGRITLYNVDPLGTADAGGFRTHYYESFLKGVTSARKTERGNVALQVLATQSGGQVLNSVNDIAKSIATCLNDAKAYYTLSFDSAAPDDPNEYHNLQVKVGKTHLTARTRTGYYAQP